MSKTVIQMAKEAGFPFNKFGLLQSDDNCEIDADQMLERLVELARADERAKLAEQPAPAAPVQEPCGWQFFQDGKWHNGMETNNHRANTDAAGVPVRDVYPSPPAQQEPLTDEEMAKAWAVADGEHNASASVKRRITRAIEAAHNIKENQS